MALCQVRSNHERLVRLSGKDSNEKDNPLKIDSTAPWKDQGYPHHMVHSPMLHCLPLDIRVWDVIAELVAICTIPAPKDPFAVDFSYFDTLPLAESVLATGAMVNFLQKVLETGDHLYNTKSEQPNNHSIREQTMMYR